MSTETAAEPTIAESLSLFAPLPEEEKFVTVTLCNGQKKSARIIDGKWRGIWRPHLRVISWE